jgi:hypothetical protein
MSYTVSIYSQLVFLKLAGPSYCASDILSYICVKTRLWLFIHEIARVFSRPLSVPFAPLLSTAYCSLLILPVSITDVCHLRENSCANYFFRIRNSSGATENV